MRAAAETIEPDNCITSDYLGTSCQNIKHLHYFKHRTSEEPNNQGVKRTRNESLFTSTKCDGDSSFNTFSLVTV